MATIIDFSAGRTARPAPSAPAQSTAEIVIFPGVRYDRAAAQGATEPATRVPRKRDSLLIPD